MTESYTSASYRDVLSIDRDGQLHTSINIYDKRDYFNFHITLFPLLSINIPFSPAYNIFISKLIRYTRAYFSYHVLFCEHGDFPLSYSNRRVGGGQWYKHFSLFHQVYIMVKYIISPWKQKRRTEGCSKFKGPETRQVQERLLVSTLEHMQVPKWDRTRCPEE